MREIFDLLQSGNWYGGDDLIEVAKGKYELPEDFKGWIMKLKRKFKI